MDFLTCKVMRAAGLEAFDNIAGGETAGIPFAALVAERMALPMSYVRKKPKGYGRDAQIEGEMPEGARVLLVEDLTTDGGSKLKFVDAIRAAGATCAHTAVVFYYGIFADTLDRLADHGLTLHWLCTWADVIAEARRAGDFDEATLADVERFLAGPEALARRARAGIGRCAAHRSWRVANLTHSCYPNRKIARGVGGGHATCCGENRSQVTHR
jgi:orotate phosphoribosyltransferase